MARYPAADWRRLPGDEPKIKPRTVIFHTMVGTLPGVDAYFRSGRSSGIESHFGVGGPWEGVQYDGVVYQWRDTEEQADANFHANDFAVSIETSDGGDITRPWTPKQVDALVALGRWLADTHGIPKRLCASPSDAGFGWHVMWGAPGPWTPVAKTCPGRVRIDQLQDEVLPRIFGDDEGGLTMPDAQDILNAIELLRVGDTAGGPTDTHDYASLEGVGRQVKALDGLLKIAIWGSVRGQPDAHDETLSIEGVNRRLGELEGKVDQILDAVGTPPPPPSPPPEPPA